MAKVFVTREIPTIGIELLRAQGHDVDVSSKSTTLSPQELEEALLSKPYDAIVCLLTDTISAQLLEKIPTVKIIANYAVGFNNIDVVAAKQKGVVVTNTPDVLTTAVAEFTLALMLAVSKRIAEADDFVRSGQFTGWEPNLFLGSSLEGKTLGIIGAGRIGQGVAMRAQNGLGMSIIYHDVARCSDLEDLVSARYCSDVEELLSKADVVSLHVPLSDNTRHLINDRRLRLMKSTSYIINTARGPIIDEVALVEALNNHTIAGAALDVYEYEPALSEGLSLCKNVVLAPHIASATTEARGKMSKMVANNINEFFAGNRPPNVVLV